MTQIIDMKSIRQLNLFEKITGIRCKNCFFYNQHLIFAIPSAFIGRAVGNGDNVKELASLLGKRVKIVSLPQSIKDAEKFVFRVVSPLTFKNLEIFKEDIIISAERQNKALLIGRNKIRFFELQKIIREFFNKELRII